MDRRKLIKMLGFVVALPKVVMNVPLGVVDDMQLRIASVAKEVKCGIFRVKFNREGVVENSIIIIRDVHYIVWSKFGDYFSIQRFHGKPGKIEVGDDVYVIANFYRETK